jgi:phage gp36-like protein
MAYATSADLSARFDERVLKDLASDTGTAVSDLSADDNVTAALSDASGLINTAIASPSSHYTATQLEAMTGDDLAYLKRIVCSLAMAYLLGRRPEKYGDDYKSITEHAMEVVDQLRRGLFVFNISDAKDAGLPSVDGLTVTQYQDLNLIPERVRNFYPIRQLPVGRGNIS